MRLRSRHGSPLHLRAMLTCQPCSNCSCSDPTSELARVEFTRLGKENTAPPKPAAASDEARCELTFGHYAGVPSRPLSELVSPGQCASPDLKVPKEGARPQAEEVDVLKRCLRSQMDRAEEERTARQRAEELCRVQRLEEQMRIEEALRLQEESMRAEQFARERRSELERVEAWLQKHGFSDVDVSQRRGILRTSTYPLHAAVLQNDSAMVQLLLRFGADHRSLNSAGRTPLQLAKKSCRGDSRNEILAVLSSLS